MCIDHLFTFALLLITGVGILQISIDKVPAMSTNDVNDDKALN